MLVPLQPPGEPRRRGPEEGQGGPPHQGGSVVGATGVGPLEAASLTPPLLLVLLQVFLKIEEGDVEKALKDRTLLGSILAAGLPS